MKTDWPRAYRALRRLLAEPDETQNALEVFYALDPDNHERGMKRMLRSEEGRRVFARRPVLLEWLGNRERLEAMPEGSLGRAYLAHIDRYGLDPAKLVELRRATDPRLATLGPESRWYVERVLLVHDLMHVLTGYGADGLGEAALLPFTWAQFGGRAQGFLAIGAGLRAWQLVGRGWPSYFLCAWRRGRRAHHLAAQPFEELLEQPLRELRQRLGLEEPEVAHPRGVLEQAVV